MADKRPLILSSGGAVRELGADDLLVAHAGTTSARIDSSDGTAVLLLDKGASGATAAINAYKSNVIRWQINLGDATAESGSNAGSNFTIGRFSDAGAALGAAFSLERSTGNAVFGSGISASGGISSGLNIFASGTVSSQGAGTFHGTSIQGSGSGLTTSTYGLSGSTSFSNVLHTAPAGFVNILSSQHTPGVSAAWQFQVGAGGGGANYTFQNNGTATATLWSSTSDERLKDNFAPLTGVLAKMKRTAVWYFTWKNGHIGIAGPQIPRRRIGIKAAKFREVWPEVIDGAPDDELDERLSADYGGIGAIAYAGVLELLARYERDIRALKKRIAALEGARA